MSTLRPRLFIGSSSESLHVAKSLKTAIDQDLIEVTVWKEALLAGSYVIPALVKLAKANDFSAFIFGPEDKVTSRNDSVWAPRDNIVYEFGLFAGIQGIDRAIGVGASGIKLKLPSDFEGLTFTEFVAPENAEAFDSRWVPALGNAAGEIYRIVEESRRREQQKSERSEVAPSRVSPSASRLGQEVLSAASRGALPQLFAPILPGRLVIHGLYGLGQVMGSGPDFTLRVKFDDEVGNSIFALPTQEFYDLPGELKG